MGKGQGQGSWSSGCFRSPGWWVQRPGTGTPCGQGVDLSIEKGKKKRPSAMGPGGPANGLRRHRRGNEIGGDLTWREVWWEAIRLLSLLLEEGLGMEKERGKWIAGRVFGGPRRRDRFTRGKSGPVVVAGEVLARDETRHWVHPARGVRRAHQGRHLPPAPRTCPPPPFPAGDSYSITVPDSAERPHQVRIAQVARQRHRHLRRL